MKEIIERAVQTAKEHNEAIHTFINVTLKEHFGSDTINAEQWFEAQRLIDEQKFYDRGHLILKVLREYCGIDAKMNMQSNEILLPSEYR